MTQNGHLPTFLLFPDDAGKWHLQDSHGNLLYDTLNLKPETLLSLVKETGANYKIIDPTKYKQKGITNDGTPPDRTNHD